MSQNLQLNFHEVQPTLERSIEIKWIQIASGDFRICVFASPAQMQTLAAAITAEYGPLPAPVTVEPEIINVADPAEVLPTSSTTDTLPASDEVPF